MRKGIISAVDIWGNRCRARLMTTRRVSQVGASPIGFDRRPLPFRHRTQLPSPVAHVRLEGFSV
jgi:hypothetical protein